MILKLKNFKKIIKKNSEIVVLLSLIALTVMSTKFYNDKKKKFMRDIKV